MVFDSISEEVWMSVFRKMRGRNFMRDETGDIHDSCVLDNDGRERRRGRRFLRLGIFLPRNGF